jgi:Ca-activated chloride channel family protein
MTSGDLQFGAPAFLWGLLLAPAILALAVALYFLRRRRMKRFAADDALLRLARSFSPLRFFLKASALAAAVIFLMLAAALPKFGIKPVPVQRSGVDLLIALDVSKSMDVEDIAPSRLRHAIHSIDTILDKLAGDRIGLIAFAGDAVLVHPLTDRSGGFRITLETLDTDALPIPGTAIGKAIKVARESFEPHSVKHKVLVIITDGETHDVDALEQARMAHDEGVIIYTLGIGTTLGKPVPETIVDGKPVEYKKRDGKIVMSKLNATLLRRIAERAGGAYYHYTGEGDVLERLYDRISRMGQKEFASRFKTMLNDIYQYPLALAVALLFAQMAIGGRRRNS